MTSKQSKTVEEILVQLFYYGKDAGYSQATNTPRTINSPTTHQAKQQLDQHYLDIFMEVIGEDEILDEYPGVEIQAIYDGRNNVRAELRKAIKERLTNKESEK